MGVEIIYFVAVLIVACLYLKADSECEVSTSATITMWICVQLALDFLVILRELSVLLIYKYHKDPNSFFDVGCNLFEIMVLMNLHSAWALFGFWFIYSEEWEKCIKSNENVGHLQQVAIFMLSKGAIVLFLTILWSPIILNTVIILAYQRFKVWIFTKSRPEEKQKLARDSV